MAENYNYVMISLNDLAKFYDLLLKGEITDINNLITNIKDNYALNSSLDNYLTTVNANNTFLTKQEGLTKEEADKLYQPSAEGASEVFTHDHFMTEVHPLLVDSLDKAELQYYFKKEGGNYINITSEEADAWAQSLINGAQAFDLYYSNIINISMNIYVYNTDLNAYEILLDNSTSSLEIILNTWKNNPNLSPNEILNRNNLNNYFYYNSITNTFLTKAQSSEIVQQQELNNLLTKASATNSYFKLTSNYNDGIQYYNKVEYLDPVYKVPAIISYEEIELDKNNYIADTYYSKIASENDIKQLEKDLKEKDKELEDNIKDFNEQIDNLNTQIEALQSRIEELEK